MAFGIEERPDCPVCGAPGGNCGPLDGHDDRPSHVLFEKWGHDQDPPPRRKKPEEEPNMADVVATERIWEKVKVPRSKRTTRLLRFTPGQVVPEADASRLNVAADGTQTEVPVTDGQGPVSLPDRTPFPNLETKENRP